MKKDGIQTRNRKVSNKNKKSKKAPMFESYSDMTQPSSLDANGGPFSLGPGTLLSYSHTPHLIPAQSPLHPSVSLPYTHHLNSGMVPTLVWNDKEDLTWKLGIFRSQIVCLLVSYFVWICTYVFLHTNEVFCLISNCILGGSTNSVDVILIQCSFDVR